MSNFFTSQQGSDLPAAKVFPTEVEGFLTPMGTTMRLWLLLQFYFYGSVLLYTDTL